MVLVVQNRGARSAPKRSVSFDLGHNVVHVADDVLPIDDQKAMWYTARECHLFKESARSHARKVSGQAEDNRASRESSYVNVMEEAYSRCRKPPVQVQTAPLSFSSSSSSTDSGHSSPSSLSSLPCLSPSTTTAETSKSLLPRLLGNVSDDDFGLEKWTLKSIAREKKTRRRLLHATVSVLQQNAKNTPPKKADDTIELIGKSCERITQPSRLFAHFVAQVHAGSADDNHDDSHRHHTGKAQEQPENDLSPKSNYHQHQQQQQQWLMKTTAKIDPFVVESEHPPRGTTHTSLVNILRIQ